MNTRMPEVRPESNDDLKTVELIKSLLKGERVDLSKAVSDVIEEYFGNEDEEEKVEAKEEKAEPKKEPPMKSEEKEEGNPRPLRKRIARPKQEEDEEVEIEEEEEPEPEEEFEEEEEPEEEIEEEEIEEEEEKGEVPTTIDDIVLKALVKAKNEISELKKSLEVINTLNETLKSINEKIAELDKRLTKVEEQPVGRKAITKARTGEFDKWVAPAKLTPDLLQKAVQDGVPVEDIVKYETLGIISPSLQAVINKLE